MENIGRVVSTSGKYAKIEVVRVSACGEKCGSCKGGCTKVVTYVEAENSIGATPSQFVTLKMDTNLVMKAAFLAYVLPLIMLIFGIGIGMYVFPKVTISLPQEIFSLILGVILMTLSYVFIRIKDRKLKSENTLSYNIERIL